MFEETAAGGGADTRDRSGGDASLPSVEALMKAAEARTGLSDFGPMDFREGLAQLLASLASEGALTVEARDQLLPQIARRLDNRLRVEDWHRRHPDAATGPMEGLISITGLPRTGTTALANMMSLDPQFRSLRPWEQADPCPPPDIATEEHDSRRLAMVAQLERLAAEQPEQMAMHLYDADATEEDHDILGLNFAAQHNIWPVPAYRRWWRGADMRAAYAYHRRALQLLQSRRPPSLWLLKAPHHKFHLEAIVDAYPDARFIFTHRDPARSIPSYMSFATSLYPPGAVERLGVRRIAADIYEHLLAGMHQALEARERLGEARFLDVEQTALDRDPIGTLKHIYAFLGKDFTSAFEAAVRRWHGRNRSGAHGAHRYTAEQFGLTLDRICSDFGFYTRRFGLAK